MNDHEVLRQAERWWAFREKSIEFSKDYGSATVRSLTLINGGAIVAALTFVGNLKNESRFLVDLNLMRVSFVLFVIGLLAALIVGVFGYFNFQSNAQSVPDPNLLEAEVKAGRVSRSSSAIDSTAICAVVSAGLSFVCFASGAFVALSSFGMK